jgi:HAE1 family hydrophobic/amphiphilic exporter-1
MEKIPGLYNIDISRKDGIPEYVIRINRIKAASLGLNMAMITAAVQQSVLGVAATRFREQGQEYDIFVRLDQKDRQTVEDIENIQVRSAFTGQPIRIGNVASIVRDVGPVSIQRDTQERAIHVTAATFGGLQQSVDTIRDAIERNLIIPPGFSLEYAGSFKDMQDTFGDLIIAVLVAILLVYAVMAAIFESFLDPFIIFFTIPLSLIGVFWALFLTGITLNVQSFIGILVLAGVVVNNGIVLVDYVNILRERGLLLKESLMEAGRRRLRPILMTTMTTVFALLPLGLGIGEGAEASQPMAVSIIGGLSVSMLLSLFFIPVIYSCFASLAARRRDKREARRLGIPYAPKPC